MKILVIGASKFIGSHLIDRLLKIIIQKKFTVPFFQITIQINTMTIN